ncbi:MAG: GNAT family N-acetyltransferase [Anaerolineales bacterium]|nr:GNAT family N-acetyltransferase [Chloroflexota bacterium]MBL6982102.1 GNAT family N-acetyltransferase [Anaerolineales bacterium]
MLIRKAIVQDANAIARVHVDSWRTTYQGIVADDYLAALSYEQREKMWHDYLTSSERQSILFVSDLDEDGVIGFVSAGSRNEDDPIHKGEIYALYVLEKFHRRGVGRTLFQASVNELSKMGFSSLLVWVLKDNPACKFYEAIGGRYLREKEIEIGDQRLAEVAYGWSDTRNIIGLEFDPIR